MASRQHEPAASRQRQPHKRQEFCARPPPVRPATAQPASRSHRSSPCLSRESLSDSVARLVHGSALAALIGQPDSLGLTGPAGLLGLWPSASGRSSQYTGREQGRHGPANGRAEPPPSAPLDPLAVLRTGPPDGSETGMGTAGAVFDQRLAPTRPAWPLHSLQCAAGRADSAGLPFVPTHSRRHHCLQDAIIGPDHVD